MPEEIEIKLTPYETGVVVGTLKTMALILRDDTDELKQRKALINQIAEKIHLQLPKP